MRQFSFALCVLTLIFACKKGGGNNDGETPVPPPEATGKTIGVDGGDVALPSGAVKIVIPPGALAVDVELGIEEKTLDQVPAQLQNLGVTSYFELTPDGQEFAVPLTIEVAGAVEPVYEEGKVTVPIGFLATVDKEGNPEILGGSSFSYSATGADNTTATVTGEISHFSPLVHSSGSKRNDGKANGFSISVSAPSIMEAGTPAATSLTVTRSAEDYILETTVFAEDDNGDSVMSGPIASFETLSFGEADSVTQTGTIFCDDEGIAKPEYRAYDYTFSLRDVNGQLVTEQKTKGKANISLDIECDEEDQFAGIAFGTYDTAAQPEGSFVLTPQTFGTHSNAEKSASGALVVTGGAGKAHHDLSTGAVVYENTGAAYGGFPGPASAFTFGATGGFDQLIDVATGAWGFGQIFLMGKNITDGQPILNADGTVLGALVADNTGGAVIRLNVAAGGAGYASETTVAVSSAQLSGVDISTRVVSSYSPPGEGPFLGITDSDGTTNGRLFHASASNGTPTITNVGEVGLSPRRIECLIEYDVCVVSNFSSPHISIIDWPDRAVAPTIRSETVSVNGPIGLDLVPTADGKVLAVATGFNDNSLHTITIDSTTATPVNTPLTGCEGPGHATFLDDGKAIAVTCNTNSKLILMEVP